VVTNLAGDPKRLYERAYCARGDMENRIKEQQLGLFADVVSLTRLQFTGMIRKFSFTGEWVNPVV
jgi:hypothetical protein